MNSGSRYARNMESTLREYWKSMPHLETIERMCFSIKQMMSTTSRALF